MAGGFTDTFLFVYFLLSSGRFAWRTGRVTCIVRHYYLHSWFISSHQCNQWAQNFFDSISAVSARFPRIMTSGGGQVDPDAPMDFIASVDETDVTNRADDGAVELFNTRLRPLLHLAPTKIAGVTTKLHRGPTLCQLQLQLIQRVIWPVTNANVCLHFQELPRLKAKWNVDDLSR